MEVLRTAPDTSSFVPIAEHQSRTPASFHDGPTVLHYHSQSCKVVILERDLVATPTLNALRGEVATNGSTATEENEEEKEVAIDNVETWVTSE
jgi:nucleotide-sensitive chloride channel 1A